jgi:hypothetical protein
MDTDTRDGSLRTQRCLPAEFHTEVPTLTYRETGLTSPLDVSPTRRFPKSRLNNKRCLIARQLTLFYRLLPYLCRIRAKACPQSAADRSLKTAGRCFRQVNLAP